MSRPDWYLWQQVEYMLRFNTTEFISTSEISALRISCVLRNDQSVVINIYDIQWYLDCDEQSSTIISFLQSTLSIN